MPIISRAEWLKLTPTEKVLHRGQRVIDQLDALQKRYNRDRASGKIAKPIQFLRR